MSGEERTDAERHLRRQRRNLRKAAAEGFLAGACAMLRPGDLALDCGANQGVVTARLAATGADVVAYEPDPWAVARLRETFAETRNVTVIQAAVARRAGTATLRRAAAFAEDPGRGSVRSTILDGGRAIDDDAGIEVACLSFSEEIARHLRDRSEIAFVKMDVEGAELEILEDLTTDDGIEPIRCLVAETHEKKFKHLRPRFKELRRRIAAQYPSCRINLDWI